MFYLRLVGTQEEIFNYLEPFYNDYRKIIYRNLDGKYKLIYMDEFVDDLLRKDIVCEITLPRI